MLGNCGFPSGELGSQVLHELLHLVDRQSNLLHRVELSNSDRIVIHGSIVDRDGEGDTTLVCASVSFAHGQVRIVNLGGNTGAGKQFL